MIEKIPFGRTGHLSSRILFGGAALSNVTQDEADRALDALLKYGVNHIDTAASYGEAELRIGPWMDHHRKEFFLATKTGERTYDKAYEQIQHSLERLRVDQIDLIQLHYLVAPDEWETAMGPGGALEAAIEARNKGYVKFIGVTGHDLPVARQHLRAIGRFDFDSILLPYNYIMSQNPQYLAEFDELVAQAQARNIAVQTIKSITRGPWHENQDHFAATWYEPFTEQADIDMAVHWVLGRPGIFLNTVGDVPLLPKVLDAANRFEKRPSDEQMRAFVERLSATSLFV